LNPLETRLPCQGSATVDSRIDPPVNDCSHVEEFEAELSQQDRLRQPELVRIPLSDGSVAIIDSDDARRAAEIKWYVQTYRDGRKYCAGWNPQTKNRIKLHHFITGEKYIDHRNGNGLDNRKSNLRKVTQQQNCWNSRKRGPNGNRPEARSRFIGVYQIPCGLWRARITGPDKRKIQLGCYRSEEEAGRAYDSAAVRLRGEFAKLNFPEEHGQ
jgi:hypothetical protein